MKTLAVLVVVVLLASIIDAAPKPSSAQKSRTSRTSSRNKAAVLPKGQQNADKGKRQSAGVYLLLRPLRNQDQTKGGKGGKTKRQYPVILQGTSVYPNYFIQHSAPQANFQNSFLEAAFLSGAHFADLEKQFKNENLTDSNGKPLSLDARADAAFQLAFGDKNGGAKDFQAKIIAVEGSGNINIINPFLLAKDFDGQILKAEGGLPGVQAGKLGDANSSAVALISSLHGGQLDAVFGPEIAPRYEIHYSPQGITLDPLPPFTGAGIGAAPLGPAAYSVSPFVPAAFGPGVGPFSGFGVAPNFNSFFNPYPYQFLPGFDSKSLKPNGKGDNGKKIDSTDQPTETTSESFQESTSESTPADSSSEPTSESSGSYQSQQ